MREWQLMRRVSSSSVSTFIPGAFVAKTEAPRLSIKKQPAFDATRKQNNKHMYGMNKSRVSVAAHKSRVRLSDSLTHSAVFSLTMCVLGNTLAALRPRGRKIY